MSLSDIREQIETILNDVSGIGVVHDYYRWSSNWDKFLDLFKDSNNKINGIMFRRIATPAEDDTRTTFERRHKIQFRAIYGLKDKDESANTFDDLIEAICTAFNSNTKLNSTTYRSGPMQVDLVEDRLFSTILCHYAELSLEVREEATFS